MEYFENAATQFNVCATYNESCRLSYTFDVYGVGQTDIVVIGGNCGQLGFGSFRFGTGNLQTNCG